MKSILRYLAGIIVLSGLAVSAQTPPKLALAGVSVTPTLAGKLAPLPTTAATTPATENALVGKWQGHLGPDVNNRWTVTIKESSDGPLKAYFEHHTDNNSFFSTSVSSQGNHVKITFYNDKATFPNVNTVEADVNPDFGIIKGVWSWTNHKGAPASADFTFHREPTSGGGYLVTPGDTLAKIAMKYGVTAKALREANPGVQPAQLHVGQRLVIPGSGNAPALAPPVSLADLTHALNVQLFDRFKGEQFFNPMDDAELKQAIAPTGQPPNPPYDLAKPDTVAQFKQAGIQYLLVTSIEDFSDQTIEKQRTKGFHFQTGVYYYYGAGGYQTHGDYYGYGAVRFNDRYLYTGGGAAVTTQGGFDPEVWQQQTIRLTVRCQLFDAMTGELKKSTTGTFPFQRDYSAVAQGKNQLSTADLCEAAARSMSVWATILVDDTIFPIRVLARNDQEITISRGSEAGLQAGQVFEVCLPGEAIKDPDTGKILDYDIKTVGRVVIAKLEPKFSHARVLEDQGIVVGATLMKAVH